MEYGLTDKGFIVKPYEIIVQEEREAFQLAFGYDIDISDESIEGAYIKNQALKITLLWEILGKIYAITDVDDAYGIYLDRLVNLVNVQRYMSAATTVSVCLWGEEGTVIPKGHLLRLNQINGQSFKLKNVTTIGKASLLGFVLKVKDVIESHAYSFQLGQDTITYMADNQDDQVSIQAGFLSVLQDQFPDKYTMTNDKDGLKVYLTLGNEAFNIATDDTYLSFPLLGQYALYECTKRGVIIVPIGMLTNIVNSISGLKSAINYASGILGREIESDAELRSNLEERQKQTRSNEIAIRNEVLNLPGVTYARVYSNREDVVVNNRPPSSYETIVIGGDEQEIAKKIFEVGPAGIQAYGNIVITVVDDEGFNWNIGFSRPLEKYIWIKIKWGRNLEEDLPLDIAQSIKDSIMAWTVKHISVGVDFIRQKLFRPVYDINGIGFVDIKIASTENLTPPDENVYGEENINISEVEIALLDSSRISVAELLT
ncbi:MAG: DUF276 domain-containing protein [Spirochaetaceae bacterium]|jgi:uncharacterized phage protein gp47/JayE|nr:DUF276 domain-containing protein [Spirochaetaceae bacterium]